MDEEGKKDKKDKFILRFHDADMRTELKKRAAKNHRTLNAELLFLIDRGIDAVDRGEEKTK